jgi:hypothetical protein
MRLNKCIVSKDKPVYDCAKASQLFESRKYGYRKLSLMKQENIRVALKTNKFRLKVIKDAVKKECGYCFKFDCDDCTLPINWTTSCIKIIEYSGVRDAKTKKDFALHHKNWCKKLGLWKKGWK